MTEQQYLLELEQLLMDVQEADREDILRDVAEYFASGRVEGKRDEDMIEELGTPEAFANELRETVQTLTTEPHEPTTVMKSSKVAFQNVSIKVKNAHVHIVPSTDQYAHATLETEDDLGVLMDIVDGTLEIRIETNRPFRLTDLLTLFVNKTPTLRVELPQHEFNGVYVENRHGVTDIKGIVAREIEVQNANGRVEGERLRAHRGFLKSSNGRVSLVSSVGSEWEVASSNGRVEVKKTTGNLKAKSSNGRVDLEQIDGAVKAKTSNGKVQLVTDTITHPISMDTKNGKIELQLKEKPTNATIRGKTKNGRVEMFGSRTNEYAAGNGASEVMLTSWNGNVIVTDY